jgi:hypothetical protein
MSVLNRLESFDVSAKRYSAFSPWFGDRDKLKKFGHRGEGWGDMRGHL